MPPDWNAERAQAEREAVSRLKNDAVLAAAFPALVAALSQMLTPKAQDDSAFQQVLQDKAVESLRTHGCPEWADALKERLETAHPVTDARLIAVELAIAQAAGELCGRHPSENELRLSRQILEVLPGGVEEFNAARAAALRRTTGAQEVLAATLRQRAANFIAAPHELALMYRPVRAPSPEPYRPSRRLIDLWEEPPFGGPMLVYDRDAYDLLRRVDPASYLAVLEILLHTGLARQIVDAADHTASAQDLCGLLRQASPVFRFRWETDRRKQSCNPPSCEMLRSARANDSPIAAG